MLKHETNKIPMKYKNFIRKTVNLQNEKGGHRWHLYKMHI